jgi:pSer/pThr/pTyr-binding forkhead associated (FHA) protein
MRTMAIDAPSGGGGGAVAGSGIGWLVPLDGPQAGELFQLRGRAIVGTAPDCDAVMKDPSISGRHCEFQAAGSGFRVNDLGSTNGTYINDKRVTTSDLIDGDNVKLGRVNFKFKTVT